MGFFRTLQQKAHEHKSSTITAAKEAEEHAIEIGSYSALISEYVSFPASLLPWDTGYMLTVTEDKSRSRRRSVVVTGCTTITVSIALSSYLP